MGNLTKNFDDSEFACKCGCGFKAIDRRLVNIIQAVRDKLGIPIRINSGCRCEKHNARVGGVKGSFHTKGLASDLSCSKGAMAIWKAVQELHSQGKIPDLCYAILYKTKNFVHLDVGGKRKNLFEVRG